MQTSPITPENLNFAIIREDGKRACFVGPDREGLGITYEDWEEKESISVEQLMAMALTGERVFFREGEPPYTVDAYIELPEEEEETPPYELDDWEQVLPKLRDGMKGYFELSEDERDHIDYRLRIEFRNHNRELLAGWAA